MPYIYYRVGAFSSFIPIPASPIDIDGECCKESESISSPGNLSLSSTIFLLGPTIDISLLARRLTIPLRSDQEKKSREELKATRL